MTVLRIVALQMFQRLLLLLFTQDFYYCLFTSAWKNNSSSHVAGARWVLRTNFFFNHFGLTCMCNICRRQRFSQIIFLLSQNFYTRSIWSCIQRLMARLNFAHNGQLNLPTNSYQILTIFSAGESWSEKRLSGLYMVLGTAANWIFLWDCLNFCLDQISKNRWIVHSSCEHIVRFTPVHTFHRWNH